MFPKWMDTPWGTGSSEGTALIRCREVHPQLFVGGLASVLVRRDWSLVIDFDGGSSQAEPGDYPKGRLQVYPLDDGSRIPTYVLEKAHSLFQQHRQEGPVLFHCAMGLSRSASMAYAMLRMDGLDHATALSRIQVSGYEEYPMPTTLASARKWAEFKLGGAGDSDSG